MTSRRFRGPGSFAAQALSRPQLFRGPGGARYPSEAGGRGHYVGCGVDGDAL